MPVRSKPPHAAPPPRPGARSHPVPQPWPAALAARQQLLDLLPQPLGLADDASHEAPDALTRQLETYLKLGSRQDEPASPAGGAQLPVFNPLMTAAVIRARMALAGAVPKMLAAARDSKLAAMAASAPPQSAMQVSSFGRSGGGCGGPRTSLVGACVREGGMPCWSVGWSGNAHQLLRCMSVLTCRGLLRPGAGWLVVLTAIWGFLPNAAMRLCIACMPGTA